MGRSNLQRLLAQSNGLEELAAIFREFQPIRRWPAASHATAWHRVAKHARAKELKSIGSPCSPGQLKSLIKQLAEALPELHHIDARGSSNILYSWALLRYTEGPLEAFCRHTAGLVPQCKPQELSNVIYALGLLNFKAEELLLPACAEARRRTQELSPQDTWIIVYSLARLRHKDKELIHHLGAHVVSRNLTEFRPQGIANLAYSLGLLGMKHRSLLRAVCAHVTPCRLEEFSEQEVANLTYGLALVRWRDTGLLSSICRHVLANASGFKPRGLSSLFYSLGLLDFREEKFFCGVCNHIQFRLPTFNAQDISNTVYGLGLLELSHQGLLSAVEAEMSGRLEEFTGQGLGNVVDRARLWLWAFGERVPRSAASHCRPYSHTL